MSLKAVIYSYPVILVLPAANRFFLDISFYRQYNVLLRKIYIANLHQLYEMQLAQKYLQ